MGAVTAHVLATCSFVSALKFHGDVPTVREQAAAQLVGSARELVEAGGRVRLDNPVSRASMVVWMREAAEAAAVYEEARCVLLPRLKPSGCISSAVHTLRSLQ